jgi:hypothetical protein
VCTPFCHGWAYDVEMAFSVTMFIQSFLETGQAAQKLKGREVCHVLRKGRKLNREGWIRSVVYDCSCFGDIARMN